MKEKQEEQKYKFTDEERKPILKEKFKVGIFQGTGNKKTLEEIIDDVINVITKSDNIKNCIKKYWFTKQIEEWKKNNNNEEPNDDKLMDIVKEDFKIRIANTMLELEKQKDIDKKEIWFEQFFGSHVFLTHNDKWICEVSNFNSIAYHAFPPYKPFFMKNQSDGGGNLNGVCICKHGNNEGKTKWIKACFGDKHMVPRCKIQFQTDKDDKITNVEIKTKKNSYRTSKSMYTIYLDDKEEVTKITKNHEEENANDYKEDIKELLYKDEINKVLIERIEDELNSQQKEVFEKIKKYIGVNKKEEKEEEEKDRTTIEGTEKNPMCNGKCWNCLQSWCGKLFR